MAKTIRVTKVGDVWIARRDGASKGRHFSTQKEAYLHAREVAINNGLTITVYYPNGGIKAIINPKNREEESNCFITTACVKYYGLDDHCVELETLRQFRDNYLMKSKRGNQMVEKYYRIAPTIVKRIEADNQKAKIFETVYNQIKSACLAIEKGDFSKATRVYKQAVLELYKKYGGV